MGELTVMSLKMCKLSLAVLLLSVCSIKVSAYTSGPPDYACYRMKPCHGEHQTDHSAYSIEVSSDVIQPGSQISVTLKGNNGNNFMGFLVTARKTTSPSDPIGKFTGSPSETRNACQGKGLTHTFSTPKNTITFTWDPAGSMSKSEKVFFKVTIVKEYYQYWIETSQEITCTQDKC